MLAPTLAIKVVIGINIKKAGILIKPMLNGRFAFKKDPEIKKPIAPNIEIINPTDAALPIALLIGYPNYLNIGTFIIAPPIPIVAEIKPDKIPKIILGNKLKFDFNLFILSFIFKR